MKNEIKPAISMNDNGKIVLDCLNDHHDYVEIDTHDMLFLSINKTESGGTVELAFLLDKHKNTRELEILDSVGYFSMADYGLDKNKMVCFIQNDSTNLQWTIFKSICSPYGLPKTDNYNPYFICIQNTIEQIKFIDFSKVASMDCHISDYNQHIDFDYDEKDHLIKFDKNTSYSQMVFFNIVGNEYGLDFIVSVELDSDFVCLVKNQMKSNNDPVCISLNKFLRMACLPNLQHLLFD